MTKANEIHGLNPEVMVWARKAAGLDVPEAARKLGFFSNAKGEKKVNVNRLERIEAGEQAPTYTTLEKMAKHYRRPMIVFYLRYPPADDDYGTDFRTTPNAENQTIDPLLGAAIREVKTSQAIAKEIVAQDHPQPLPFVGSCSVEDPPAKIAESILTTIRFDLDEFRRQSNLDDAFKYLRRQAEQAGIFVVLIDEVGKKYLDADAFRGFALADPIAPYVAINKNDARTAWSFTLLHELAHIWLGESGVSGGWPEIRMEELCNNVASQILLKDRELDALIADLPADPRQLASRIGEFASRKHISRSFVAYRLYLAKKLDKKEWTELNEQFRTEWRERKAREKEALKEKNGGGAYYNTQRMKAGNKLLRTVASALEAHSISVSRAGKALLNANTLSIYKMVEK